MDSNSYDVINKIAIENRHIVFPLISMSIDMLAQYAKNQNELWYNTQNEIHKNYNPYFRYLSTLHYTQNYSDDTTSP